MNKNKSELDQQKSPETTGHQWDGIEEYNTPAPRWWLIVWLVCIIWALVYWIFYPALPIPGGNNKGLKNWTKYSELNANQKLAAAKQEIYLKEFSSANFDEIAKNPQLMEFALAFGKVAFKQNCTVCHGSGAAGGKGFPNLNDDDWLWGGKISDIYQTIKYGIRSTDDNTRQSEMPAFGVDKILTSAEIATVAQYVIELSDKKIAANKEGKEIFSTQCSVCHGIDAKGNRSVGAPNLTDGIWLYGKNQEDIIYTITNSRKAVMPNWNNRLDDNTIKALTIYIHSLGGGE